MADRKDYYDRLMRQQRGSPDITDWLQWFVGCLGRAVASAEESLSRVLFKARFWERINEHPVTSGSASSSTGCWKMILSAT